MHINKCQYKCLLINYVSKSLWINQNGKYLLNLWLKLHDYFVSLKLVKQTLQKYIVFPYLHWLQDKCSWRRPVAILLLWRSPAHGPVDCTSVLQCCQEEPVALLCSPDILLQPLQQTKDFVELIILQMLNYLHFCERNKINIKVKHNFFYLNYIYHRCIWQILWSQYWFNDINFRYS